MPRFRTAIATAVPCNRRSAASSSLFTPADVIQNIAGRRTACDAGLEAMAPTQRNRSIILALLRQVDAL